MVQYFVSVYYTFSESFRRGGFSCGGVFLAVVFVPFWGGLI